MANISAGEAAKRGEARETSVRKRETRTKVRISARNKRNGHRKRVKMIQSVSACRNRHGVSLGGGVSACRKVRQIVSV